MVITDKQELRRCVKQLVRRADVCEADCSFDFASGELGVMPMLDCWAPPSASPNDALRRAVSDQTPFSSDAVAMFAALDAMDLPTHDLNRAETLQREYERSAYLRELLDTMRAKCVMVRIPMDKAEDVRLDDERLEPLLCIDEQLFEPGRYGVDYAAAAQRIAQAAQCCGAKNIRVDRFDEQAMRYCLLPLCEDQAYTLHVHLNTQEEISVFSQMLHTFDAVHVLVQSCADAERSLIEAAANSGYMYVCLNSCAHMSYALSKLGTRFVPFSAHASQPEMMLGHWIAAKEELWQALAAAYLPLARAGFELQSAAIERDVRKLLSENLLCLCRREEE